MRITCGGNVGIGTTSPANKFHVQDSDYNMQLRVFGCNSLSGITPTGYATHLDFWSRTSTSATTYGRYANIAAHLVDWTNGALKGGLSFSTVNAGTLSTKMYICPSGEVGIGTTTPAVKFHVCGSASSFTHNQTNTVTAQGWCNGSSIAHTSGFGASYRLCNSNDQPNTYNAVDFYTCGGETSPGARIAGVFNVPSLNKSSLSFHVDDSSGLQPRLCLMYDGKNYITGNLGIGCTSPSSKLEVAGEAVIKFNHGSAAMGTLYPSAYFLSTNGNCGIGVGADTGINGGGFYPAGGGGARAVSYTLLTLPTNREV